MTISDLDKISLEILNEKIEDDYKLSPQDYIQFEKGVLELRRRLIAKAKDEYEKGDSE